MAMDVPAISKAVQEVRADSESRADQR